MLDLRDNRIAELEVGKMPSNPSYKNHKHDYILVFDEGGAEINEGPNQNSEQGITVIK